MEHEITALVKAIEILHLESNSFKDYMFQLVSGLFSSMLGAGVAYFTLRYQDNSQIQKERINTINDWMLLAEGAMQSLVSIKYNYHGKLTSNPFQRTMEIRSLISSTKNIDKDIANLSFIIPKREDIESQKVKWRQLPRIRSMIENYNFIIELWRKRGELDRPIKEKIIRDYGGLAFSQVTREQIIASVGASDFAVLMDLTERAIKFTDDLIVELNDFMANFPDVGKSLIHKKYCNRYGSIITYTSEDNPNIVKLIKKTPEVDHGVLAELFGKSVDDVKREYTTGYE